jgi:hypothetical protein
MTQTSVTRTETNRQIIRQAFNGLWSRVQPS